jgi:hypothetical protein
MRGLLCLPSSDQSASRRRACRLPKENEDCNSAAKRGGRGANGRLGYIWAPTDGLDTSDIYCSILHNIGEVINFPGTTCVQAVGLGSRCDGGTVCVPGFTPAATCLLGAVCIFFYSSTGNARTGLLQGVLQEKPTV